MPIVSIDDLEGQPSSATPTPAMKLSGIVSIDDLEKQHNEQHGGQTPVDPWMSNPVAQATKGLYEGVRQIPGVRQFMDINPELGEMAAEVPEPKGIGQSAGRIVGRGISSVPAFMGGEALVGGKLIGGAMGIGAQETAGQLQEGKPLPQAALEGAKTTAGTYLGGKAFELAGNAVGNAMKPVNERISDTISDLYSKAVKPTIVKGNANILNKSNANVESGIRSIINNKENLSLGEQGAKLPENLPHAAEAISQTKDDIFNKYNEMQKQATGQGVKLSTNSIIPELENIANNKAVRVAHPSTVTYLQGSDGTGGLIGRLKEAGDLSPQEAQDMIKGFNGRLKSFYKNPSPNDFGTTAVDALVANNLRKNLDDTITNAVGEGYQGFKNQYGALSSMEKDVSRAAQRSANYQARGLLDFTDVYTGEQIARGLLTGNLPEALSGIAGRSIKEWYKRINSPDATIKNMFSKVSDLMEKEGSPSFAENMASATQKAKESLGGLFDAIPSRRLGIEGKIGKNAPISKAGEVEAELLGGKRLAAPQKPITRQDRLLEQSNEGYSGQPIVPEPQGKLPFIKPTEARTGPKYPQVDPTKGQSPIWPAKTVSEEALPMPGPSKGAVADVSTSSKTSPDVINKTRPSQVDMSKGGSAIGEHNKNIGKTAMAVAPIAALGASNADASQIDVNKDANIKQLTKVMKSNLQNLNDKARKEGIQIRVTSAYRTPAEQKKLYAQGRTSPGKIVTNLIKSKHNDGSAFDIVIMKGGKVSYDPKDYKRIGEIGKSLGLMWGGDFKKLRDYGHFEINTVKKGDKK